MQATLLGRIVGRVVDRPMLVKNLDSVHLGIVLIILILKALCKIMLLKFRGNLNPEHVYLILTLHSVLGYPEFLIF